MDCCLGRSGDDPRSIWGEHIREFEETFAPTYLSIKIYLTSYK